MAKADQKKSISSPYLILSKYLSSENNTTHSDFVCVFVTVPPISVERRQMRQVLEYVCQEVAQPKDSKETRVEVQILFLSSIFYNIIKINIGKNSNIHLKSSRPFVAKMC